MYLLNSSIYVFILLQENIGIINITFQKLLDITVKNEWLTYAY